MLNFRSDRLRRKRMEFGPTNISRYTVLGSLQITKDNLQPGFIVFHESWSELDHATGGEKRRKEKQIEKKRNK